MNRANSVFREKAKGGSEAKIERDGEPVSQTDKSRANRRSEWWKTIRDEDLRGR